MVGIGSFAIATLAVIRAVIARIIGHRKNKDEHAKPSGFVLFPAQRPDGDNPEFRSRNNVTSLSACPSFQMQVEFWRRTGRARSWVHSIPDLSLATARTEPRKLRAKVQVGTPLAQATPPFEGRKPTLIGLRAVTTVSTIIYGPCWSGLGWRTSVAKVKVRVLLPAWYAQPNHEGTADPLASVLAKSRLHERGTGVPK
jgi:hypothetical protein